MAYDVQRFNELTKQMRAYAHYTRAEHLELAARRAARRPGSRAGRALNQRLRFRLASGAGGAVATARRLLESEHPNHQAAGRTVRSEA